MELQRNTLYWLGGAALAAVVLYVWLTPKASAADLGGTCCSDLEERIAELEATTAKKGNRKMSVTVHGQINKALLYGDFDASLTSFTTINGVTTKGTPNTATGSDWRVRENSAEPSFVGVTGTAQFAPGWVAGAAVCDHQRHQDRRRPPCRQSRVQCPRASCCAGSSSPERCREEAVPRGPGSL